MNYSNGSGNEDTFFERVWRLTGERNENQDLYSGAILKVRTEGETIRIFLLSSGRELPHLQTDKTTPHGPFNHFKITEVRQKGNRVESIKVLAREWPENSYPITESQRVKGFYLALMGSAFFTGLVSYFILKRMKS